MKSMTDDGAVDTHPGMRDLTRRCTVELDYGDHTQDYVYAPQMLVATSHGRIVRGLLPRRNIGVA